MPNHLTLFRAAARAAVVAGPLFLGLFLLFGYVAAAPASFPVTTHDILTVLAAALFVVPVSMVVGIVLAFPTCVIAGGSLWFVGSRLHIARSLVLWIGVGAVLALASIDLLFAQPSDDASYAFIGTASACAAIVRSALVWE